ncbi:MAG: hypothetical protein BRD40_00810 [Bacteroidetes bacterium QS_1_65_9]|nr:MAG: hypothetical protein BRD40_00810 [Bacteroidetes bacterium QS_1_65_9]
MTRPFSFPLDTVPPEFEEAVSKLRQRSHDDLIRAHKHHRRALKTLREDAYDALPEETRDKLAEELLTNLTALNEAEALDDLDSSDGTSQTGDSYSVLRTALTWLR